MKYKNASEIFPDELLKEIQKYAAGEIIYVPSEKTERKQWGAGTGARIFYQERNEEIRHRYYYLKQGIRYIAEEFNLSEETIRKIIYK